MAWTPPRPQPRFTAPLVWLVVREDTRAKRQALAAVAKRHHAALCRWFHRDVFSRVRPRRLGRQPLRTQPPCTALIGRGSCVCTMQLPCTSNRVQMSSVAGVLPSGLFRSNMLGAPRTHPRKATSKIISAKRDEAAGRQQQKQQRQQVRVLRTAHVTHTVRVHVAGSVALHGTGTAAAAGRGPGRPRPAPRRQSGRWWARGSRGREHRSSAHPQY